MLSIMKGIKSLSKYKYLLSILLLVISFVIFGVLTISLILNLTPNNVLVVSTSSGKVKLELTDNITLEDDSGEKLAKKLTINSKNNTTIKLGELVKITSKGVMFEFSTDNQTYYVSAIKKVIKQLNKIQYMAGYSLTRIYNKTQLEAFRDNVNKGETYFSDNTRSEVRLSRDVDLEGADWTPIGSGGDKYFAGLFAGFTHTIRNCTISSGLNGGFFGYVNNARIINVRLENVKVVGDYSGYVGCLVGEAVNTNIEHCWVDPSCSINIGAVTGDQWSKGSKVKLTEKVAVVGGLAGKFYGTDDYVDKIDNCSSQAKITCNFPTSSVYSDAWNEYYMQADYRKIIVGGLVGDCSYTKIDNTIITFETSNVALRNCLFGGSITINGQGFSFVKISGAVGMAATNGLSILNCAIRKNFDTQNMGYVGEIYLKHMLYTITSSTNVADVSTVYNNFGCPLMDTNIVNGVIVIDTSSDCNVVAENNIEV